MLFQGAEGEEGPAVKGMEWVEASGCAPLRAGISDDLSEINRKKSPSESVLRTTRSYRPPAKAAINLRFIAARSQKGCCIPDLLTRTDFCAGGFREQTQTGCCGEQ